MGPARLFFVLLLSGITAVRSSPVLDANRLAVRSTDFDSISKARSDQSQRNHVARGEDGIIGPCVGTLSVQRFRR
jgi:hypothetical protein